MGEWFSCPWSCEGNGEKDRPQGQLSPGEMLHTGRALVGALPALPVPTNS